MLRLILLLALVFCVLVGGLALALNHWFAWKGLVAFPFIVLALLWLGKFVIGAVIKRLALGLFGIKSQVLRGATLQVHSILPVPKPPEQTDEDEPDADEDEEETDEDEADEEEEDEEEDADDEADDEDDEEEEADEEEAEPKPREYFALDLTITPSDGSAGRVWEPGELLLTREPISSLADLDDKQVGTTEDVRVWNGTDFGPDDDCKYAGAQRLKITMATRPGTVKAWLQYYNEALGEVTLPPWTAGVKPETADKL